MILFSLSSLCMLGGKCLSISLRNCLPRLVVTDALKGGLYHTICLLRVLVRLRVSLFLYCSVCVYPLLLSAAWYVGAASKNACSDDERAERRFSIIFGSCFLTAGGWLDLLFM